MAQTNYMLAELIEQLNITDSDTEFFKNVSFTGEDVEFKKLNINDLIIPDYQRKNIKFTNLKEYPETVGSYDLGLHGTLTVTDNGDGTYNIVDGQRRSILRLMILLSKGISIKDVMVPCIVVKNVDYKQSADLFWQINGGVSSIPSNEERLYARYKANRPDAVALAKIIIKAGLACGELNAESNTRKIKVVTLQKVLGFGKSSRKNPKPRGYKDEADKMLYKAVDLLEKADSKRLHNAVLAGLCYMLNEPYYKERFAKETLWNKFEEWFLKIVDANGGVDSYSKTLNEYKNVDWSLGIATGMVTTFAKAMNRPKDFGVTPMQEKYQKAIKGE
ncbi:MAG: hypothetical protein CMM91_00315 [Rickettsiales bacterium]|nr:hypothetical protein [Rickettsiales bacterium]|tara:strand:- start:1905 stop:2900 length:996 start_codon:yes stop_codon:yes gene_type:complete